MQLRTKNYEVRYKSRLLKMLKRELVDYGGDNLITTRARSYRSFQPTLTFQTSLPVNTMGSKQCDKIHTNVRFSYIPVGNEEKPADPFASAFFSAI
ncbi:hypothetical protein NC653_036046 [Populus alba x Populus x berolinensis]|uniref:Uncharacterized protein n=1 Tax=Populus alba x Populus x berolinensis TaxID=444605 RepID=A0AAD6PUG0_9ROSI|nr:hypothetical protein NC653_036046 [Populus alba x Populus x berolinensis]